MHEPKTSIAVSPPPLHSASVKYRNRRTYLLVGSVLSSAALVLILNELQGSASPTVAIWITIFLSAMLSSVVGFAFSAIAGSVLFHLDGNHLHVVQTMLIASISLQAYSVCHLRLSIRPRLLAPFLWGGGATLGLGVYIATQTEPKLLLLFIGAFLLLYGLYTFRRPAPGMRPAVGMTDFIAGALGGITGPVAAFPGAFVTISCSMKDWDKYRQRGVVQPYILIMQILSLGGLLFVTHGRISMDWTLVQYAFPALAGAYFGLKLFEQLTDRQFLSMIAVFLTLSGIAMIAKGL